MKKKIINLLNEIAAILEFKGANKFKVSAFKNAAFTLRKMDADISAMIENNTLKNVKGIGKGILKVVEEFYYNSESEELKNLMKDIPKGVLEMMKIRGLGPKKVKQLFEEENIASLDDLETFISEGKLVKTKGFGASAVEKIKDGIARFKESKEYFLLNEALEIFAEHNKKLKMLPSVSKTFQVGEIRRIREIIRNIDILLLVNINKQFEEELSNLYKNNKIDAITSSDIFSQFNIEELNLRIFAVDDEKRLAKARFLLTGSDEFLSKYEISNINDAKNEEEIFEKLRAEYLAPEMREAEIFEAEKVGLTESDLDLESINGLLHFHTTYSDGINSLEEMRNEAENAGYSFLAVCDHSKSAYYANGLNEKRLSEQFAEIETLNQGSKIKIYRGIESDILKEGSLDYDESILKEFHFVVASVHSIFNLSEEEMTARIIKAIENPYTDVLGHPTGRILLRRNGYKLNIRKVIDACSENNVAIEINCNPHRLDLDWRNFFYAREKACKFAINPDAHSVADIHYTKYGVYLARKGGMQKSEVINYFNKSEFEKYLNRKIKRQF